MNIEGFQRELTIEDDPFYKISSRICHMEIVSVSNEYKEFVSVFKKLRFVSLFMFVTVKTALEMSVTKTVTKDLKKIRTVPVLAFMFVATVSAFEVSITKTVSEKHFDWFW